MQVLQVVYEQEEQPRVHGWQVIMDEFKKYPAMQAEQSKALLQDLQLSRQLLQ